MLHFEIYLTGILAAFANLFINYCIGKPASENFSPYEIFSRYTVWLSKRRVKKIGILNQYNDQYLENLFRTKTEAERITLKNDFNKILYDAADPFFTWERAVGMCPVCTGFWVSAIVSILYAVFITLNLLHLVIIVLISHITIRVLNKII